MNTSVGSTGTELSGIKNQMNGSVTSTGSQLDAIEKSLNDQLKGIETNLSDGQTQLNSGVNDLSTQLTNDAASMNGKVNEAKNKEWSNPTEAFTKRQQDHVVETVEHRGRFDEITTHIGGTPEQKQQISSDTSKLQTDRTNAIKAVETAKDNAVKSAQTQFNTLSADKNKVIADAQAKLDSLTQAKDAAIQEVESQFADITASISDIDKKFADVQALKDNLFANAYANFNAIETLKNEVLTNTQEQLNGLSNSWSDWVKDTKQQINVWTKITDAEDRWFNTTPTNPALKVGLPLIGVIDTGFSANHSDLDYSRITLGKDWVDGDDNPLMLFGEGKEHGTQILEIIGATRNNGIGINGINDKSPLWLGRAVGSNNWAQSLIEFVDAAKASKQPNAVVNLSFDLTQTNPDGSVTTRYELTPVEQAALTYAKQNNILIVTSTGNQGSTMSALAQATKEFDNIFVVGAAEQWQRANYSSYGEVDYANYGKGVDILAQGSASNGASGTSVAAAKVTGAASLVWAANPGLNHTQVMDILRRTATDLNTPNWDAQTGMGLLNIAAAVHLAKATKPEVYIPRELELVQNTLKAYQIPEVHWPQFYEYYYRAELETKFTGSKFDFVKSVWTEPSWGVSSNIIAAERATARQRNPNPVFNEYYDNIPFSGNPSRGEAERHAHKTANELRKALKLPDLVYVRYVVTSGDGSSRAKVWKEIDLDAQVDYNRKVTELNAAKKRVKDIETEIAETEAATQKEIDALTAKIAATKRQLRVAISIAEKGKLVYVKELNAKLTSLYQQLAQTSTLDWIRRINLQFSIQSTNQDLQVANQFDEHSSQSSLIEELKNKLLGLEGQLKTTQEEADNLIANLKAQLKAAEKDLSGKTKAVEDTVNKAKDDLDKEIKDAEAAIEARKQGFFDKLGASVTQFSKDLSEQIKSNLKGVDVGAVLDVLKKIPVVGTVVNGIEGLIALVQGDWKEVVKSGVNGVLKIIPGGSAVPEPLVNILINVGWGIISKDYKTALKDVLKELDVKDKVANTFVDVAWAMKDGDWKDVLGAGLSGAGFNNADKFVGIAWGVMKDGDYKKALTAGLEVAGLDKLGINSNQAQAFVNSAIALKDNNQTSKVADELLLVGGTQFANSSWVRDLKDTDPNNDRAAVTQGLSAVGFKNVEQWVNMAWDVKEKNYLSAISAGFSLAGFTQGKDWVDMAWSLQRNDYLKALSTGFKVAGFAEGKHLAKAAVNLREGKYLDAFFEGIRIVPAVGDLINAFEAVGAGNFRGVANSLAKVATNPTLLKLLVS
ncbi:S8 family serine peptidase [Coleofasciculus sp. FACHB-129]|nr:S8 family serine peptidase [Coleofasciculus sp. FACHB-129]